MCLIILAFKSHPEYKVILAGNRDEFYDRPSAPASFWKDAPDLLAGRDLHAGGTWLGVTKKGRIAAITNYRDPETLKDPAPTRGKLLTKFLLSNDSPEDYLSKLVPQANLYNGFNLLLGDQDQLFWYSNHGDGIEPLTPGLYGLSNHLLDTPWPKVIRSKNALACHLKSTQTPSPDDIFRILRDRSSPEDQDLPSTGMGLEWERVLSPIFIDSPIYGTRSSSILFIDNKNRVTFNERTFDDDPDHPKTVTENFQIKS